jgi:hypothetical protein
MLVALLGGATTNALFAQTITSDEEWQCIDLEFDVEANIIGDVYPFAKMVETPYGILLYGRFSEIDGISVNNIALYKDYGIENAGIAIGGDVMSVLINDPEVIFITSTGLFTWDGESITDWGINIQMFAGFENNWEIETEIIGEDIVISGFIQSINGENYNTIILNKDTKIIEHKILLPGNCRGFGKIGETFYFGYDYWPWGSPTEYDYQPIISFNTGSLLMSYEQLGIPSAYVTDITEYQGKIYTLINRYPALEEVLVFDGINWDFTGYFAFGQFIKKDSDLYLSGGIQFNTPEEPYDGNNGLLKYNGSEWDIMVDKNQKSIAGTAYANNTWYAVEEFGSVNYYTDYQNDEETDYLCLANSKLSIAKLGDAEIEVSIIEEVSSDLQIFLSGENLIVKSNLIEGSMLEVHDLTGKIVLIESILPGTNIFNFPFNDGIYIANKQKILKI